MPRAGPHARPASRCSATRSGRGTGPSPATGASRGSGPARSRCGADGRGAQDGGDPRVRQPAHRPCGRRAGAAAGHRGAFHPATRRSCSDDRSGDPPARRTSTRCTRPRPTRGGSRTAGTNNASTRSAWPSSRPPGTAAPSSPGCSVGVLTRLLASRCDTLLSCDVAAAAVRAAAGRTQRSAARPGRAARRSPAMAARPLRPRRVLRDPVLLRRPRPGAGPEERGVCPASRRARCSPCTGGIPSPTTPGPATTSTACWPRNPAWPGWSATTEPDFLAEVCDPHRGEAGVGGPVDGLGVIEAIGVVVPAHDEETLLPACLVALRRAAGPVSIPVHVIVVADACTDRTRHRAGLRRRGDQHPRSQRRRRPRRRDDRAAAARRRAHDPAATWLATTDADTRRAAALAAAAARIRRRGLGRGPRAPSSVTDWDGYPPHVPDVFEQRYAFGPGPHPHVHGANLGIRASAYLAPAGSRRCVPPRTTPCSPPRARLAARSCRPVTSRWRPRPGGRRARRTGSASCCVRWPADLISVPLARTRQSHPAKRVHAIDGPG